ncbi:hypothetical protein LCGC14_0250030 [marine sediment metagenome]|uniref:Uncharacterized protein n=1 Tax=marine sediment metagenome TaxID=412755 RepID=A0A0F9U5C9_9ZZZZ
MFTKRGFFELLDKIPEHFGLQLTKPDWHTIKYWTITLRLRGCEQRHLAYPRIEKTKSVVFEKFERWYKEWCNLNLEDFEL